MLKQLPKFPFLLLATLITRTFSGQPIVSLETVGSGFSSPVDVVNAGDSRLFVVEQSGYIRILHPADGSSSLFMNIDARVSNGGGEQGLLGLAFDPNYASNGYFYVNYINNAGNTRISRFSRDAVNPDLGNPSSEVILLTITQPYTNHNGGDLIFGPDGYLYIGMGDGGSGGDPGNRAQDITTQLLGKMLRIDVSSGGASYAIPPSNPFVGLSGDDEIWAFGLRNPWRFSFDRLTGDLWIGDVGQDSYEEIDFQAAGASGGTNYGWRCYEGNHPYNTSLCDLGADFTYPILEYPHDGTTGGYVVTGGFVYRGTQYPSMYGYYICCDFSTANYWTIHHNLDGTFTTHLQGTLDGGISSFGEGSDGELYACNLYSGEILHLTAACGAATSPTVTGITSTSATINWNSGGATSYKVVYKAMGGSTLQVNTTGTSVTLTGLVPSTAYTVKIKNKCPGVSGMFMTSTSFSTGAGKMLQPADELPTILPDYGSGLFNVVHVAATTSLQVFDISGRRVGAFQLDGDGTIDLSHLDAGIYFVQFMQHAQITGTEKIILTR